MSINVPTDKARAVVDAMERDMGTTLATKKDLEAQTLATRKDLEAHILATRKDIEMLKQAVDNRLALVSRDIAASEMKMTLKLGSMLIVGFGSMLAALRFWV